MASKHQAQRLLVVLNIGHIVVGLLSLALALAQFSSIALDNAPFIDFRLLNAVHVATGSVGAHMIAKNFGSVVAKTLYILSLILSLWTSAFYADTLVQESSQFDSIREIRKMDGGEELINDEVVRNHGGKLALCSVMILLSLTEAAFSGASLIFLERLATDAYSNLKVIRSGGNVGSISIREVNRKRQMAFVALMKIFFSLATIVLGAYLESLYKRRGSFMKIGWQELTGAIAFAGACVDLHAIYGRAHNLLNLKVSLVFSIASAVLSLKTLDYTMCNYFVLDVREYSRFDQLKSELQENSPHGVQVNTDGDKKDAFIKFVIHAAIIGCLAVNFAHSVISAVEASSYIERRGGKSKSTTSGINISVLDGSRILGPGTTSGVRYPHNYAARTDDESDDDVFEYDEALHKQKACAGTLQCVWGLALIALCVISLVSWDFSRGYDGGAGVLWLGCLFVASGLVNANRPNTFTTSIYVLSVVSLVLAFERGVYSLNVIYQAARNPRFKDEMEPIKSNPAKQRSNYDAHVGRIVLYSIEACVLVLEFLTASWTAVKVTQAINRLPRPSFVTGGHSHLKGPLCSLGLFHLLYAFVAMSISIAAEVALWGYNVHVSYLVYMTNGIVVLANVFVQWTASQKPQFLLCSAIINIVTASTSFFVIAPAVRDLYTLVANYRSMYEGKSGAPANGNTGQTKEILEAEQEGKSVQEWIIGLNALVLLLAIAEYVISIVSGMICSYLLHHAYDPTTSDLRFSTLRSQPPTSHYWSPSGATVQPPSVLASKLDNDRIRPASRHQSHTSLAAVDGMMMTSTAPKHATPERVPERYFGGTNDFRANGRHANRTIYDRNHTQHQNRPVATSTGLRRMNTNGNVGNNGSLPSVEYGSSNGYKGNTNSNGYGHDNSRANAVTQAHIRLGYQNGSYMTTYT